MFRENTVVVLGAGSSFEAGLPLGATLAKTLSNDLNLSWKRNQLVRGNPRLSYALLKHPNYRSKGQEWIAAARMISGGVQDAESIDRFVDIHNANPDVQSIAKLGIVCALLDAEKSSKMFLFEKNTRSWKINPHAIDVNKRQQEILGTRHFLKSLRMA